MKIKGELTLTGSKSETNRLLILQALSNYAFDIIHASNAQDSTILQAALTSKETEINVGIAGTAMRFLTAYLAIKQGRETILTGESRMLERPIGLLVKALNELGADISFIGKLGYPPLKIRGVKISRSRVEIPAHVSSQYITALMLIAPFLENGLMISLKGKITSLPYISITLGLLRRVGVEASFKQNQIYIKPGALLNQKQSVESDWSSASYYYALSALSDSAEIGLQFYRKDSLQGDKVLVDIYKELGVASSFLQNKLILRKQNNSKIPDFIALDLNHAPDIAQTIAVTCSALKIKCKLTGLETLKIKETDRLEALKTELTKFGSSVKTTDDTLEIVDFEKPKEGIVVETYNDHRMAMAFAPLKLKYDFKIKNKAVVEKSYPYFWKDFEGLGITF